MRCGGTLHYLKKKGISEYVVGIEKISDCREQVQELTPGLDEHHVLDIEKKIPKFKRNIKYDLILLLDVLEHLIEPYDLIIKLCGIINKSGQIMISLPNIRYLPILYKLIFKNLWRYEEFGILDKTHLRFFTSKSFLEKCQDILKKNYKNDNYIITLLDKNIDTKGFLKKSLSYIPFIKNFLITQNIFLIEIRN